MIYTHLSMNFSGIILRPCMIEPAGKSTIVINTAVEGNLSCNKILNFEIQQCQYTVQFDLQKEHQSYTKVE